MELVKFNNQHAECSCKIFYQWMVDLYGDKWPQPDSPTCSALIKSVERLNARLVKMKKQHTSELKEEAILDFL